MLFNYCDNFLRFKLKIYIQVVKNKFEDIQFYFLQSWLLLRPVLHWKSRVKVFILL